MGSGKGEHKRRGVIKPLRAGGSGIMPEDCVKVQIELPILRGTLERADLEEER